jgi:hypothetical protein
VPDGDDRRRLFQIVPTTRNELKITEIALEKRNSTRATTAHMTQADRFHVTQDGEGGAIIFDGLLARRAGGEEIPVGTLMAYGMGRLVVVRDRDIYFGDLFGSHAGDPAESVLKFTETTFLNEGFAASVTASMGRITALAFSPQQDTATGDGELLVFCEHGVASIFLSLPREQWKESAFQRISLLNVSARGHRAVVSVNGDVWFRATDGWRFYRQARAEIQGYARVPLSTEVNKWMKADTMERLDLASAIHFDNQIIGTCTPQWNNGRPYHLGLTSLDFDVLSSFGNASKPAWNGHWSKLRVTQLVSGSFNGVDRAFAFALDDDDQNHVYELTNDERRDFDGPIECELVSRSMVFQDTRGAKIPFNEKQLYGADVWIDDVTDAVTLSIDYKPDQHPEWQTWKTLPEIAPVGTCGAVTCGGCPTIRANFKPRRTIGKPPDECDDEFTKRKTVRGFEFQVRLRWLGHAAIRRFRLHAKDLKEQTGASCE